MRSNNFVNFPAIFSFINNDVNIFPCFTGNLLTYINQINYLNTYYTRYLLLSNLLPVSNNKNNSNNEDIKNDKNNSLEYSNTQEKKKYFNVINCRNQSLFNISPILGTLA